MTDATPGDGPAPLQPLGPLDPELQAAVVTALSEHLPGPPKAPWHGLAADTVAGLARWCAALAAANEQVNLTGITAPAEMAVRHVLDSLTALPAVPPAVAGQRPLTLLDLGSGGGAPGLPLALARPDLEVVLCESRARKAGGLQCIVDALDLGPRVTVVCSRAETWLDDHDVDLIVTRAVGSLADQLRLLSPRRERFGQLLAMKGPAGEDELEVVRPRLPRLGFEPPRRHVSELPGGAGKRLLYVFAGGGVLSRRV